MPLILPHYFTPERIAEFWSQVDRSGEHWLWLGALNPEGYGYTRGFVDSASGGVHRIAWFLSTGEDPGSKHVLHTCDVKNCVRNDDCGVYSVAGIEYPRRGHLFLGNNAANHKDWRQKYLDGVVTRRSVYEKITMTVDPEIAIEVRNLYRNKGWSQRRLAREFGIPLTVIRDIVIGDL